MINGYLKAGKYLRTAMLRNAAFMPVIIMKAVEPLRLPHRNIFGITCLRP
jgi:hypothetical protein